MSRTTFPFLEIATLLVVLLACVIALVPGVDTHLVALLGSLNTKSAVEKQAAEIDRVAFDTPNISSFSGTSPKPDRIASRVESPELSPGSEVVLDDSPQMDPQSEIVVHQNELHLDYDSEPNSDGAELRLDDQIMSLEEDDFHSEGFVSNDIASSHENKHSHTNPEHNINSAIEDSLAPDWDSGQPSIRPNDSVPLLNDSRILAPTNTGVANFVFAPRKLNQTSGEFAAQKYPGQIKNPFFDLDQPSDIGSQTRVTNSKISIIRNRFTDSETQLPGNPIKLSPEQPDTSIEKQSSDSGWEIEKLPAFTTRPKPVQRSPMTSLRMLKPENQFRPRR